MTALPPPDKPGIGAALAHAIRTLREELGDPFAPVTVIVPALPNAGLARRSLALEGDFIRVWFSTPDELVRAAVPATSKKDALPAESPHWLHATLGNFISSLDGHDDVVDLATTLQAKGWRKPLVNAVRKLEHEGVTAEMLQMASVGVDQERLRLLRAVQTAVEQQRISDGVCPPDDDKQRAVEALSTFEGVGQASAKGVILVGDGELSHATYVFLQGWLAARDVVRLELPGDAQLPEAPEGVFAAAPDARVLRIGHLSTGALSHLQSHLFASPGAPVDLDDTVVIASTADDRREKIEAVREVQAAVAAGMALDRIAVVIPNRTHIDALSSALDRAGIPVTWHVGLPLQHLSTARLLRLALSLADDEAKLEDIYGFLQHPAMSLRPKLGMAGLEGKARWRRLLSKCGYALGVKRVLAAVERQHKAALETHAAFGADAVKEDMERAARDVVATSSLVKALAALSDVVEVIDAPGTLAEHAERWRTLMKEWARTSSERKQVDELLKSLAQSRSTTTMSLEAAVVELEAYLEQESPRGRITDAAVKVLSPMQLLGGDFDLVCVLGLVEGTFPSQVREDPLVSDALIGALNDEDALRSKGVQLRASTPTIMQLERRRLAAVVGACTKKLWLSVPRQEFDPERPLLPSTLLLELLAPVVGRRVRYADLNGLSTKTGSRAEPVTLTAKRALGAAEYLASRLLADDDGALEALASHPNGRRLLQLHQALHDVGAEEPEANAWATQVSPDVMPWPGLDGEPLSARQLAQMLRGPGRYFFRWMLGAWAPPKLRATYPLRDYAVRDALRDIVLREMHSLDVTNAGPQLVDQLAKAVDDAMQNAPMPTDAEREQAATFMRDLVADLVKKAAPYLGAAHQTLEATQISDAAPFVVEGETGALLQAEHEGHAVLNFGRKPTKSKLARDEPQLAIEAVALSKAKPVDSIVAVKDDVFTPIVADFDVQESFLVDALTLAASELPHGRFVIGQDRLFGLAAEQDTNVDRSLLERVSKARDDAKKAAADAAKKKKGTKKKAAKKTAEKEGA